MMFEIKRIFWVLASHIVFFAKDFLCEDQDIESCCTDWIVGGREKLPHCIKPKPPWKDVPYSHNMQVCRDEEDVMRSENRYRGNQLEKWGRKQDSWWQRKANGSGEKIKWKSLRCQDDFNQHPTRNQTPMLHPTCSSTISQSTTSASPSVPTERELCIPSDTLQHF